ncbi:MAG: GNAT family N-acetyltransferase [Pseudomonadota bacterium]
MSKLRGLPFVRNALPGDAPRIAELYRQLVDHPAVAVLPERIASVSADPNTGLFVCEHLGEVEGTAMVSLCADVMFGTQPFAVVENIVVNEQLRGQGLGAALLRHIEAFCLANDCSKIMLLSSSQREHAHRFFEHAGFVGSKKCGFIKYRGQFQAHGPS